MNTLKRLLMLLPRYEAKDVAKEVVKHGRKASPLVGIWRETCSGIDPVVRWIDVERACAEAPETDWVEQRLRTEWWLSHGCPFAALYGDDGEMQCNNIARHGLRDFKRDDLLALKGVVESCRLEALPPPPRAEALAPSPDTDDLLDRLEEYLDDHSDVNDGDSGPIANTAMSLLDDLQRWRKKRV
jgi:hypothetical protein